MHATTIQVRFDDVDTMGVVHHPRYLIYFEVARTAYMRDLGAAYGEIMRSGTHLAVIEVSVTYQRPAHYEDVLTIVTWCTEVGRTRVGLNYEVLRGDERLATGFTRLGSTTPAGKAKRMPPELRQLFEGGLNPLEAEE